MHEQHDADQQAGQGQGADQREQAQHGADAQAHEGAVVGLPAMVAAHHNQREADQVETRLPPDVFGHQTRAAEIEHQCHQHPPVGKQLDERRAGSNVPVVVKDNGKQPRQHTGHKPVGQQLLPADFAQVGLDDHDQ